MNVLKKLGINTLLMTVLFAILVLPIGAMGLAVVRHNNVLSATDEQPVYPQPTPTVTIQYRYNPEGQAPEPQTEFETEDTVPESTYSIETNE